jgi:hypothetical protein
MEMVAVAVESVERGERSLGVGSKRRAAEGRPRTAEEGETSESGGFGVFAVFQVDAYPYEAWFFVG